MDEKALEAAAKAIYLFENPHKRDAGTAWGLYRPHAQAAITAYLEASGIQKDAERIERLKERILDLEDEGDVARKRVAALEREIRILEARGE